METKINVIPLHTLSRILEWINKYVVQYFIKQNTMQQINEQYIAMYII